jgi:hypothetical protein
VEGWAGPATPETAPPKLLLSTGCAALVPAKAAHHLSLNVGLKLLLLLHEEVVLIEPSPIVGKRRKLLVGDPEAKVHELRRSTRAEGGMLRLVELLLILVEAAISMFLSPRLLLRVSRGLQLLLLLLLLPLVRAVGLRLSAQLLAGCPLGPVEFFGRIVNKIPLSVFA